MKILAITSCPNGIAHTYMAAENLEKAAKEMGVQLKVETQGSIGVENEFSKKDIEEADGIIIAADKTVNKDRFHGKKLLVAGVQDGIRKPEQLIKKVMSGDVPVHHSSSAETADKSEKKENPIYRHLMNGVSYMVPFIVVGGLLIAVALTLGGEKTPGGLAIPDDSFWKSIEAIGGASFTFMVPILAGFIAYSIADRPGLAPGVVGGYIAANGSFYNSEAGAGFIGGIIAGFLAGYVALYIKKIKVPKALQPIMPIIIIPVLASLIVGLAFVFLIGAPVAGVFTVLTDWLAGMQGTSSILLALILGAMISFDMGGPVNKVAFLFGSAMIGEGNYEIMGPIAAAICIPPIGLGLATFIGKKKFQAAERETGKASFTMGLFGITEGAIPFAAQDPLRVIPSIMVGSMTGSVIAMLGHVGDRVAHGGPIVAVLGAVDNVLMFFVAVIVGSLVTAVVVNLLKKDVNAEGSLALAGAGSAEESMESQGVQPEPVEEEIDRTVTEVKEINQLTDITNLDLINIDLEGSTRDDVIDEMIQLLNQTGSITSAAAFKEAILNREAESTTGIGMNIAIPHGKSDAVTKPSVVFGIKKAGVDWNSLDGSDAKLIFMIAVPKESEGNEHLKILQLLSRQLMDEEYREKLLEVGSKEEAYRLLEEIK
ncbi:PTS mannose transporter subunit IIABC [[Bacillus] enclensis]|uniref:PTS system D-mannose-specific IIA component, Fru family /PTS system D-mannose-specific IIB component, Fru family /PTS system D-mannose-specific IIC component, Fru family n=1 Tax=[Bacillus] enclensis TaxID=1402860 RepID=A0A0V8HCT0_9BACI|nr:PTS fructose transporter subunit IIABC [[Bacillus] enclensis]KSU60303.1 PTS mannose transporter subunit IIABC [[Bacillus] enclensis]SCC22898.1 PTS system D-mannose-specific IIA component, Fru family /PTS system D-mannose-specific IIB component, Fru family /PTS system D-mannose-specific IIC component, Fru family [[Bacillus] enclensis]